MSGGCWYELRHPHLVRVFDLVAEGDALGIVMELVDGEDLRRVSTKAALSPAELATLLAQTASALAAVHAAGLVHRDIKPENVLVTGATGGPSRCCPTSASPAPVEGAARYGSHRHADVRGARAGGRAAHPSRPSTSTRSA